MSSSDTSNEQSENVRLTGSERSRLLASERRRVLLDVIEDRSIPVGVEALAADVGEAEFGESDLPPERTERISITLHHNHLPRLAQAGVLDYDATANHVVAVRTLPTR